MSRYKDRSFSTLRAWVETEVPLTICKTGTEVVADDSEALEILASQFNEHGLPTYSSPLDEQPNHNMWRITLDQTIEPSFGAFKGNPIEIKSPIISMAGSDLDNFKTMWAVIGDYKYKDYNAWKMANLNIHISCGPGSPLPFEAAQKLAFCVVYFERSIDDYVPADVQDGKRIRPGGWKHCNRYTKRNRVTPNGGKALDNLPDCWKEIRKTTNIDELTRLICYDDQRDRRVNGVPDKNWKWNFYGLGLETIEFRHMPPAQSDEETVWWLRFIMGFVAAAWSIDAAALDKAVRDNTPLTTALGAKLDRPYDNSVLLEKENGWASEGGGMALGVEVVARWIEGRVPDVEGAVFDGLLVTCQKWENAEIF
ncbi:hypothetical protein GGS20DRAFT_598494 [Poronia punctata]|nr:hypothetical protein GGS20DRAFT_598494 [Poronia punctata]